MSDIPAGISESEFARLKGLFSGNSGEFALKDKSALFRELKEVWQEFILLLPEQQPEKEMAQKVHFSTILDYWIYQHASTATKNLMKAVSCFLSTNDPIYLSHIVCLISS